MLFINFLQRSIKIFSIIFIFFFGILQIQAVQYGGANAFYIPGIQGVGKVSIEGEEYDIDGKNFWNFSKIYNDMPSFSQINCVGGILGGCNLYLAQFHSFIEIDMSKIFTGSFYESHAKDPNKYTSLHTYSLVKKSKNPFTSTDLSLLIRPTETHLEFYRYYKSGYDNLLNTDNIIPFARIENQECGIKNTNKCVFYFADTIFYSSDNVLNGVYLAYSDITLFNNKENNASSARHFYDEKLSTIKDDGFFNNIFRKIVGYKGSYGLRLSPIDGGDFIYYKYDSTKEYNASIHNDDFIMDNGETFLRGNYEILNNRQIFRS